MQARREKGERGFREGLHEHSLGGLMSIYNGLASHKRTACKQPAETGSGVSLSGTLSLFVIERASKRPT